MSEFSPVTERPVKLVFLFADVGGGHRAPAEAVREALRRTIGDRVQVELVDALADYAPFPYNRGRQAYTQTARFARPLLGLVFHALDTAPRIRLGAGLMWRPMRRAMRELLADHTADLFVSFHPTYSYPLTWLHIPSVFVFTDLVANHALWCAPGAERYLVPTTVACERAIHRGAPTDRVEVTGLPVHPRFLDPIEPPHNLRQKLGLPCDKPIILLSGGGEGMGRVYDIAHALGESGLDAQLVVIAGRNQLLREELEAADWPMLTRVLGFTRNMSDWMAAATVLISKSGSNTIAEALVRGLPMVLFDFVPGQEEGNPQFVIRAGAGAYCPRPAQVVNTLRAWLSDPKHLEELAVNARAVSRPNAALNVARIVYHIAEERTRDRSH
ncbi:MAG: MGDG synthase family glycosyltransferase [Anaerolineae bacterium]